MSNVFALTQRAYRFFNDDGSESTATVAAAENTALTKSINAANPRTVLRISLAETGAGSISGASTDDYQLQYSYDGGAYTNVTTSSSVVKAYDSSNLTNDGATTDNANLSNAGSGSFVAGEVSEDGLVDNLQITANNFTEFLFTLEIVHADVADGKNIDFRVLLNGATTNMTYSVTPRITVSDTKRHWVGGTAEWNATVGTKWAKYTGGTGGASVPTSTQDVYFDANSGAGTITIGTASAARHHNHTGFTGTVVFTNGGLKIYGDLTLEGSATYTPNGGNGFEFLASGSTVQNVTFDGVDLSASAFRITLNCASTATVKFLDAVNIYYVNITAGILDLNNINHLIGFLAYESGSGAELKLGTGTLEVWAHVLLDNSTIVVTPSTSIVKMTGSSATFRGAGKTFYNLWLAPFDTNYFTVEDSNTFNQIKITPPAGSGCEVRFEDGTTQTVSSVDWIGTSGHVITVKGVSTGGWSISDSGGTNAVEYCAISYSTASGGATWNAYTTNGNTDAGNNSGWNFSAASQGLVPSLFSDGDTFHSATVAAGPVGLAPSLYSDADAFHAPTAVSSYPLTPSLFADADAFFSAAVTPGAVGLTPSLFADGDTFHSATVAFGASILQPSLYADADTFHAATVAATYGLTPALFSDGDSFYTPAVSATYSLSSALLSDADTFYTALVVAGPVGLEPSLYSDADTFFAAAVSVGAIDLSPPLLGDADTFYSHSLTFDQALFPPLLTSGVVYAPQYVGDLWSHPSPASATWVTQSPTAETWTPQAPTNTTWTEQ